MSSFTVFLFTISQSIITFMFIFTIPTSTISLTSHMEPLGYWQVMASNNDPLAPMSLAYLSTPGKTFNLCDFVSQNCHLLTAASTDIECGFLKGRLIVYTYVTHFQM